MAATGWLVLLDSDLRGLISFHFKGGRRSGSRKGFLDVAPWVPLTGKLVRAIWLRCGFYWHPAGEHWAATARGKPDDCRGTVCRQHAPPGYIHAGVAGGDGAICGDQIGYFVGRWIGYRLLARWGRKVGLSDERLELGRFLFRKYGAGVVFLGRFVAFLRTFAAVLAGANRMPWHSFLLWNALGGICWTALYGFGAYALGDAAKRITGPLGIGLGAVGALVLLAILVFVHRNERRLIEDARREMRGTLGG